MLRRPICIAAAALAIAAFSGIGAPAARAETADAKDAEPHLLSFLGSDVWQHWAFAYAGVLWSPNGVNNEGLTVKLLFNGGVYEYRSGAFNNMSVVGRQYSVTAMPGWRFKYAGYDITVLAGFDLQDFRLSPNDPDSRLQGMQLGVRAGFELWHEPSPTTMFAADASISSLRAGDYARVAYGWRMLDRFYIGPEAQIYYTEPYLHRRFGVHITAFKDGDREWSGGFGYANDNDGRNGLYLRFGVLMRR